MCFYRSPPTLHICCPPRCTQSDEPVLAQACPVSIAQWDHTSAEGARWFKTWLEFYIICSVQCSSYWNWYLLQTWQSCKSLNQDSTNHRKPVDFTPLHRNPLNPRLFYALYHTDVSLKPSTFPDHKTPPLTNPISIQSTNVIHKSWKTEILKCDITSLLVSATTVDYGRSRGHQDIQISGLLDIQISGLLDIQISGLLDIQISGQPDTLLLQQLVPATNWLELARRLEG